MANLVGSDIGLNYKGLINLGATVNQNVSGSLQYLTDGDGNNLPIQVSSTATQLNYGVGIGGAPTTAGFCRNMEWEWPYALDCGVNWGLCIGIIVD